MVLGKIVGTIVTTISHPHYKNRRLLVVQPLVMDGDTPEPNEDFIALDNTQAGIGDTVLVNREGNGARQALKIPDAGVGPLVVCVPSMGDVRGEYRFLIPQLVAAGYRAVSMDVRGLGETSAAW